MPAFIRVTWIDVDDEEKRNLENQYKKTLGLAINLKEFRNGAHIQEKGTIDLKMNGQFDSFPRPFYLKINFKPNFLFFLRIRHF